MSLTIDQIAEAFCSYRFAEAYPDMADKIKWNIVVRQNQCRAGVIDQCDKSAKFLETVSAAITRLNINRAGKR